MADDIVSAFCVGQWYFLTLILSFRNCFCALPSIVISDSLYIEGASQCIGCTAMRLQDVSHIQYHWVAS